MSDSKKDLTRIEDLGEYLHDLSEDADSFEPPPELPSDDDVNDFGTSDPFGSEDSSFNTEESDFPAFQEETPSYTEETDFSTDAFSTNFESISDDEAIETPSFLEDEPESFSVEATDVFSSMTESEPATEPMPDPEPEPELESELTPEPVQEHETLYSKEITEEKPYKAPETFEDLKKFAESSHFSGMSAEGNPSFSVLLKNVRYIEDVHDIMAMLKELNLISDSEEQIKARLMRGHLLVPRVSEYAAIFLAHKLRRFDIDIQVGLSDEIHPPKHQEAPEVGLVSKHNLYQNQGHHFHFDDPKLELSQIIISATPHLEGYQVIKYLGVASEHKMLESELVEDETSEEIPRHYTELAQKLKAHALKAHANAVIGLNYQLTPLPSEYGLNSTKYRLSCTGNLVWVNKL